MSFTGCDLTSSTLSGADLKGALLADVEARQASFESADLTGAKLQRIRVVLSNLGEARLDETDLRAGVFDDASFDGARFREGRASLDGAKPTDPARARRGFSSRQRVNRSGPARTHRLHDGGVDLTSWRRRAFW